MTRLATVFRCCLKAGMAFSTGLITTTSSEQLLQQTGSNDGNVDWRDCQTRLKSVMQLELEWSARARYNLIQDKYAEVC